MERHGSGEEAARDAARWEAPSSREVAEPPPLTARELKVLQAARAAVAARKVQRPARLSDAYGRPLTAAAKPAAKTSRAASARMRQTPCLSLSQACG